MVYLEQMFLWNGKISDNCGFYMTIIKWYDHIQETKSIVTYDTKLNL